MGTTATCPHVDDEPRRTWRTPDGHQVDAAAAVLAFQSGDQRGLETLVGCFSQMMSAVARRYLHAPANVEDAVQDAWMAFVRSAGTITAPQAIGAWLSTTTAHAAMAIGKSQARCVPAGPAFDVAVDSFDDDDVTDDSARTAVRDAVRRLADDEQRLIDLLFTESLTYAQVVDRTGRPMGSIGPTRQRIMRKLQRDRSIRELALGAA
ncbi:MAG: sigma-70 family RNA polymerase sigma factor [Ilumatobacteraceae bacterium]